MTDNTRAKSHLKDAERKLNDLSNVSEINRITAARSLDLFSTLTSGNNLFVDDEVIADIGNVRNRLDAWSIVADAAAEINDLNTEEAALAVIPATSARRVEIGKNRRNLLQVTWGTAAMPWAIGHTNIINRRNEYTQLNTYAGHFNTATKINTIDVDLTIPAAARPGIANINQPLDPLFKAIPATTPNANYVLCDDNGKPLPNTGGNYTVQIGGQTATLSGVNLGARTLDLTGVTITPPTVDLSQPLNLSINAVYPAATIWVNNINLVCNKKIQLQLRNGPAPIPVTQAVRQAELNRYNSVGNIVEDAMDASWFNHHEQIEREAVFAGLKHADGPKFDKLTAEQKEDLYRKIQANIAPIFAIGGSWARTLLDNVNNYDTGAQSFYQWITADNHPFSRDPEINRNAANWRNNLHNTLEDQITAYFQYRFNRAYTDNADGNTFIKTQLTEYLTEQLENKQDNDTHEHVETDLHAINFRSRRRFRVFGRNDNNYMRFFSGMNSVDIGEQHVNIITDKGEEWVKYTMKIDVSGKNQISTTVKIGDKKERTYKAGNPMALMESILRNPDIPQGKTRMHIAYNVAKWLIQKAQEDDISLRYRNAAGHNMVIRMDGKNIVLDDEDDLTNYGWTNRRITETLFDYSLFEGTNSWEHRNTLGRTVTPAPDNRNLRMGIDRITRHFNCAMGQLNDIYNESTQRRFLGIMRSNTSSDFPTSPWTSPIKKLLNCRTNTNFDFSTSVSHNGKSVQIERQKNTFILRMWDIELKGKDLGKLLNKRKWGVRLFDGIERDICGEVYKNMIEKLRTNSKIARSNFGVMDPMTGRMYIVDEDGQLGYIRAEDARTERRNLRRVIGTNTVATWAIAGGLTAAGIATWGTAALAAGLSWWAAWTAASRAGAGAAGVNLVKDFDRRIIWVGYGILDHPPVGRTMCDEAETREIYKNPFLMGKLMKAMNLRLGQI